MYSHPPVTLLVGGSSLRLLTRIFSRDSSVKLAQYVQTVFIGFSQSDREHIDLVPAADIAAIPLSCPNIRLLSLSSGLGGPQLVRDLAQMASDRTSTARANGLSIPWPRLWMLSIATWEGTPETVLRGKDFASLTIAAPNAEVWIIGETDAFDDPSFELPHVRRLTTCGNPDAVIRALRGHHVESLRSATLSMTEQYEDHAPDAVWDGTPPARRFHVGLLDALISAAPKLTNLRSISLCGIFAHQKLVPELANALSQCVALRFLTLPALDPSTQAKDTLVAILRATTHRLIEVSFNTNESAADETGEGFVTPQIPLALDEVMKGGCGLNRLRTISVYVTNVPVREDEHALSLRRVCKSRRVELRFERAIS